MPEESKIFMMPSNNGAAGSCEVMAGEKDAGTAKKRSANDIKNPIFNNIPPSKTDKPRPHRCDTCSRGFARLEHLKRHERSHTKEKPFECPQCQRCFARRDLLLRHQQKLHMTTTPLARTRNRRGSTANTPANGLGRVRKNSLANGRGAAASMRPRANTISHIDGNHSLLTDTSIPPVASSTTSTTSTVRPGPTHTHNRHSSLAEVSIHNDYYHQYSGLSTNMGQRVINHGLSRIDTNNFNGIDFGMGLRTAPPMTTYNAEFDYERFVFGSNPTINPNALHYSDSPHSLVFDGLPTYQNGLVTDMIPPLLDENCEWMNNFENNLSFQENSSPSLISASSPGGISDIMLDGSNNPAANSPSMWPSVMMAPRLINSNSFSVDPGNAGFHDMMGHGQSPLHNHLNENEPFFSTPPRSSLQNNFEGLELN